MNRPDALMKFMPLAIPVNLLPERLPQHWLYKQSRSIPESKFWTGPKGLIVQVGLAQESDERCWLHVSVSTLKRMPTYEELKLVRRLFIADRLMAFELHPPKAQHVNFHPFCRHFYACLDDPGLPDFTRGLGII
jgi:hypothetical protein